MRNSIILALACIVLFIFGPPVYVQLASLDLQDIDGKIVVHRFDGEKFLQLRNGSFSDVKFQLACFRFGHSQKFPIILKPGETVDIDSILGWGGGFQPNDTCYLNFPTPYVPPFDNFSTVAKLQFTNGMVVKTKYFELIKELVEAKSNNKKN